MPIQHAVFQSLFFFHSLHIFINDSGHLIVWYDAAGNQPTALAEAEVLQTELLSWLK